MGYGERRYHGNVGQMRKHQREERHDAGVVEKVKGAVGGAYSYAKEKVGEYQENKRRKEEEDERLEHRSNVEKHYTAVDYGIERRLNKALEEDDEKTIDKLMGIQERRNEKIEDKLYAEKRMKERDEPKEPKGFIEKIQAHGRKINEQQKSAGNGGGGMPSMDMFGVGSYGGNSDMFGMSVMGTPMLPSEMGGQPRRTAGRAPKRTPRAQGYDGSYDMFGMSGLGGGNMFEQRSRRVAPHQLYGGTGTSHTPKGLFDMPGGNNMGGSPFASRKASRGSVDPFGMSGLGGSGGNIFGFGTSPKRAVPKRKARKTTARRKR